MQGKHLCADARDAAAMKQLSRAISAWDPLVSVKFARGESLYEGVATGYGVSVGDPVTLTFRGRSASVDRGDIVVMPPAVRIAAAPAAEFLWVCHEGLAPEHLRGPRGLEVGFEHRSAASVPSQHAVNGRHVVLPDSELQYRMHFEIGELGSQPPRTTGERTELHYVLEGEGELRLGSTADQLAALPLQAGQVIAVGPALFQTATPGLLLATWLVHSEMVHRRRVREANP